MIYLIGGAPRVGKSIVGKHLSLKTGFQLISTDEIEIPPDQSILPGFSGNPSENILSPEERVKLLVAEAEFLQNTIKEIVKKTTEDHKDVIIEGVHVLPKHVSKYGLENIKVIFLGSRDTELILRGISQNDSPNNWLKNCNEVVRHQVAEFVRAFSAYIFNETEKSRVVYKERSDDFDSDVAYIIQCFT